MGKEPEKRLIEQVQALLEEHGQRAYEKAKNVVLQEHFEYKPLYDALRYFMEETWYDAHHPALISLTCEAVGGDPAATTDVAAAIILLAAAADIHDDIIDKSKTKGSKLTVLGRFGQEIALLVGDALIFEGSVLLHKACESLTQKQRRKVLDLTKQAFHEMESAEAKETSLKRKIDLSPEEYRKIIEMKAAVAQVSAKVGAVIGGGDSEMVDALGHYGRTLGILMTMRDEFIDTFEPEELKNRVKNECLPLPLLYAFKNRKVKKKIIPLLDGDITEVESNRIVETIWNLDEVSGLRKEMKLLVKNGMDRIRLINNPTALGKLKFLLSLTIQEI